jgi:hypothetical protein
MSNNFKKLIAYASVLAFCIYFFILFNQKYSSHIYSTIDKLKSNAGPRKYIYFANNLGGFNNQLQQLWMYKLIAKKTGRELVISGFHPENNAYEFTPLSDYIDESSYLDGISSISAKEFNSTCRSKTQVISKGKWGVMDSKVDQITDLVNEINSSVDECLMIKGHAPSYFYYWSELFLKDYPEIKEKSLKNFKLPKKVLDKAKKYKTDNGLNKDKYLAVHLRRGDFEKHCKRLARYNVEAFSFNQLFGKFPALIPEDPYMDHCFPSIKTIVKVIDVAISKLPSKPKSIFLMHNANSKELEELIPLLNKRFDQVLQFNPSKNSGDNDWRGTHSLLTEMTIGSESDYFIGNLHSTVTSNLLAIREVKNLPREHIYFF